MSNNATIIVIIIWTGLIFLGLSVFYKLVALALTKRHRRKQADKLRFLKVKMPQLRVAKSTESEITDVIQNMKQNIQYMNQLYKSLYSIQEHSIHEDNLMYKIFGPWYHRNMIKNSLRWQNYMSLEMIVENEIIKFIIGVPKDHLENVEKMISTFFIGSVVEMIDQPKLLEAGKYMAWGEFILTKKSAYPIKTYDAFEADPMESILSAFSKTTKDEKLALQILIAPTLENQSKRLRKEIEAIKEGKRGRLIFRIIKSLRSATISDAKDEKQDAEKDKKISFSQQELWDLDKKVEDELFSVKIRALATSEAPDRPEKIINDLARWFNQYAYVGLNNFHFKKTWGIKNFAREFIQRLFFTDSSLWNNLKSFGKKNILNVKELSSIIHLPNSKFNRSPRIQRQRYKIIAAPENIPAEGILLGHNLYAGIKKEIRIMTSNDDRFRHVYALGQTGSWKTTLLITSVLEDIKQGNGFCYIDPHGDAIDNIMEHFPKERIDDLIYFDLSNTEYPLAFNPLDGAETEDERDVITNDLVEMFVSMYGEEIFGPRIQDYFRNACFLLMEQPEGWTLVDIMRLFTDDAYAESKIRNIKNPVITARWNKTYKKMGEREKAEIIPFIQAKFWPFTTGTYIRNVIGQPKSAFNFFDAMNEKKVILVKLAKWLTWEINSQLIGRMIAMQIKLSALKRAALEHKDRIPYFLYIDEFQNYVSKSIESILSEARKYKLGLTIAHQYIEQLKQKWLGGELDLSKTVFGNVGNLFIFKIGAPDAEFLEKEMAPEFSQMDLVNADAHRAAAKIAVNNQQTRPFSFQTRLRFKDPKISTPEKIEIMKQISALKRWTKRELVDKEIYFRVGV